MGFVSREPPPRPERTDLSTALDGLHYVDAEWIRNQRHLASPCSDVPRDREIVAVLAVVTEGPNDRGLLCATDREITYYGERWGTTVIPMRTVYKVDVIHRGNTLSVTFGAKEVHFGITAKRESFEFVISRIRAAAKRAQASPPDSRVSAADELAKFAELHESGVLTDAEFASKKAELLG